MSKQVETAKTILRTLNNHGYEAYFVGGFVRDYLIGRESDDIDITTNATPDDVESLFSMVKQTGRKFGGVTVLIDSYRFEVTTFRKEAEYANNRHPNEVVFSDTLEDDVIRRDFTMNGLAMDANLDVIDLVNGKADIESKLIRAIGDPLKRFEEDALRMLRAFRFVGKLGFDIEPQTLHAIRTNRELVKNISIERVMQELDQIFSSDHQKGALQAMIQTDLHRELYGLEKGIETIAKMDEDVSTLEAFILSFVLNDIDDQWRFSNKDARLIYQVMNLHEVTKEDSFNPFLLFANKLEPCLLANRINVLLGYKDQEDAILKMWDDMPVHDVCDLAFKGQDILQLTSLQKRSVIGLVIDDLLHHVITGILPNTYNDLKPFALKRVEELQQGMSENNE